MRVIEFGPCGLGRPAHVIADRVTHFYLIDYNGNYGTCLVLDTGKEVNTGEWPTDVARKLAAEG